MEYVEAEGNSIDEAIAQALQQLGVERDKVEIEIVSNTTRGLFGLGGRKAKVRATLRTPLNLDPTARSSSTPSRTPTAPARSSAAPRPPAAPAADQAGSSVDRAALDQARTVMQEIVHLIGSDATVEVRDDADGSRLVLEGDASGVLIGRRGQTLDGLEYLINRIVSREEDQAGRIVVDSQNYRARRRQALEELAHRLAERARRRGKTVTLNPMSPRDRRIVHLALQDDPSLVTRSSGKGYFRKLLIIPEKDRRGTRSSRENKGQ